MLPPDATPARTLGEEFQKSGGAPADTFPAGVAATPDWVRQVAAREVTLLLTGETGTGKTHLARLIHELSPRRDEPFLVIACGALPPALIEREMFGHVRGAFPAAGRDRPGKFAAAQRGTLLLREIHCLPGRLQSTLLRAVEERSFVPVGSERPAPLWARLIAASDRPLETEVKAGRFRADLYDRLNALGFHLPPLRDRPGVIARLVKEFLRALAPPTGPGVRTVAAGAWRALAGYDWPGNIRELRNVIARAAAHCRGSEIDVGDLPEAVRFGRA